MQGNYTPVLFADIFLLNVLQMVTVPQLSPNRKTGFDLWELSENVS